MTKENFEKYDKEKDVFCESCKTNKPVKCFTYRRIYTHGRRAKMCRVCEWFYNHYKNSAPSIKDFSEYEIKQTISFILECQGETVNELAQKLHRTVDEVIELLDKLNIKNLHISVEVNCACCRKKLLKPINVYKKNHDVYCSLECYWKDKPNKIPHGEKSPFYNRIKTICTNCGKDIERIPYKYNEKNRFDDNHNFCSQKCYWEYRSKYYIKEKSNMYNYHYTEEQKENIRLRFLKNMSNENRLNTKIQLKVNEFLDKNNIQYEREKMFDYYSVDNYLEECNGIIEVMGNYWHSNPLIYNESHYLINNIQKKQLHRDKIKKSYIYNKYNIKILYLWESDILKNPELCKKLIQVYITDPTTLLNYNSFNWTLNDQILSINKNLIIPYQDMSVEEYRHLIKEN